LSLPLSTRRSWVEPNHEYSIRRQCRLAGISRSNVYYEPVPETEENLLLMRLIDEQYMRHPEFGYPRITDWLLDEGHRVNHKRVARLMRRMGLQAITPGPHTSNPAPGHKIYPYLLRNIDIEQVNQVWSTDITYSAPILRRHHGRCCKSLSMSGMYSVGQDVKVRVPASCYGEARAEAAVTYCTLVG